MTTDKYTSCNVLGAGKLNKDVSFKIIDLSAEKVRIKTDAPIELNSSVNLDITLDEHIYQINIKANGSVSKKIENGYEVLFTDLTVKDKIGIDELMKSTCGIV